MSEVCPACGGIDTAALISLPALPVEAMLLHADRDSAISVRRGDVTLHSCRTCALVWNAKADPTLVTYDARYENSQLFSPAFHAYASDLASELSESLPTGGRAVEIGCGKGEFLDLLASARPDIVVEGYDPSYDGEVDAPSRRITIHRSLFEPAQADLGGLDLIVMRHVLEHLADPVEMIKELAPAIVRHSAIIYTEVPALEYTLERGGIWDVLYEHFFYFSEPSLRAIAMRSGLSVQSYARRFSGQFHGILLASPGEGSPDAPDASTELVDRTASLAHTAELEIRTWQSRLSAWLNEERAVVIWGAGAKTTTFLALVPGAVDAVTYLVDSNPRKAGRFAAGSGLQIQAPRYMANHAPDIILVMNPAYLDEMTAQLGDLGLDGVTLLCVV